MLDIPYFMTSLKWFYFDYDEVKWKLTDDAPEKAKKSYEAYCAAIKREH